MGIPADEWAKKSDEQIITLVGQGLGYGGGTAGQLEMTRRLMHSIAELRDNLETFRDSSERASDRLLVATWALVVLTIALVVLTVVLLLAG